MEIGKLRIRKKGTKYQYVIPVKENLVWKQITKSGYVKEKDARNAGNERIRELLEDGLPKPCGITFREVARMVEKDGRKSTGTVRTYHELSKVYEPIADKPIADITYQDVADIIFEYQKKVKHATVRQTKSHGSRIMNFAIKKLRIIKYNPFDQVDLQAPKRSDKTVKQALTLAQIDALLNALKGSELLITAFMALCGLRISEARGLTRGAIKDGHVTVKQQRTEVELKEDLKTERSYRTVPMPKKLVELYREYPVPLHEDALIFPMMSRQRLMYHYNKAGFKITPHELRHSYTTNCIAQGIDYKTTAALIGDSVEMVMKVYSHVNTDMLEKAKAILEDF